MNLQLRKFARIRINPLKQGNIVQHYKREMIKDKEHSMKYLYIIEAVATYRYK